MTAYSARLNRQTPSGSNIKEGRPPKATKARRNAWADLSEAEGFVWMMPSVWTYTWEGNFPSFVIAPGTVLVGDERANGYQSGLVAYGPADIEILFPYGCNPGLIKTQLDDQIYEIMQHDANIVDAPLVIDGQAIGPVIPF